MKISTIVAACAFASAASAAPAPAPAAALEKRAYYTDIGEIWGCVWAVGPIDCKRAKTAASKATKAAEQLFPTSLHNGKGDAFRHCYWNALMVHYIGAGQAKEVADAHENKGKQPKKEKEMDLYNNSKGRTIGKNTKGKGDSAAKTACKNAANNGTLRRLN
ncbi:hypothetical protein HK097_003367 [Rhizophlyctis rosea]|uniref:DUF6973 domain-containing protein n=1 Tax=Rhizophlyctis rosea TaxID=64517 RepID=A0AAD5S3G7_9FUNG|nr:hypothetical protein HK097_003367 [Rhizophlyctis rosea]